MRFNICSVAVAVLSLILVTTSDQATAQNRPEAARAWSPSVYVTHVTEKEGRQPCVGAEVLLETWVKSPRGENELRRTQVALTNEEGLVTFKRVAIQRNVMFRATTIRDGLTFSTTDISGFAPTRALQLQTYPQTNSTEGVTFDVRAELEVREEVVLVRMRVGISNPTDEVIVAPLEDGIRAPMLLPAIGDSPWVGYLPTEKAIGNISVHTMPSRGVLRVHRGSVFYSGPIFPGAATQEWRLTYVVPIHKPDMELVLQADKEVKSLAFIGAWANSLAPTIHVSQAYDSKRFERAGRIIHRLTMLDQPPAEQSARITISGLPYALSAESNLALFGGSFLFILFLLFALGARPRE